MPFLEKLKAIRRVLKPASEKAKGQAGPRFRRDHCPPPARPRRESRPESADLIEKGDLGRRRRSRRGNAAARFIRTAGRGEEAAPASGLSQTRLEGDVGGKKTGGEGVGRGGNHLEMIQAPSRRSSALQRLRGLQARRPKSLVNLSGSLILSYPLPTSASPFPRVGTRGSPRLF